MMLPVQTSCSEIPEAVPLLRIAGLALALASWLGCAGPMAAVGDPPDRYRHREIGYSVPAPGVGETLEGWRRINVDETDLAFEARDGSLIGVASACSSESGEIRGLARQLVYGIRDRSTIESFPVESGGLPGWSQRFSLEEDDRTIGVKTVTLIADGCVIDWFLVASGSLDGREEIFDAWWQGFDPGPLVAKEQG